ncbi:MAG: tetratricopeptide repeat protein [Thioploca sp.]|nr:tetratricopeptide repeat protein [Thioploca sp.]
MRRAEPLYQQALEIRKTVLGENHSDYAISLNNLALLYKSMGNYTRAEPLYQQALEIRKTALGESRLNYAQSLSNLAKLYYSMGDYTHAKPLYQQALKITKKVLGENHSDYATRLNNLAMLYYSMGDYTYAETLFKQALEITKKVLGKNHPLYAHSLNNLAVLYYSMGDYTRAEPFYQQAQQIKKTVLGKNHPDYAQSLNNLAALYRSMGEYTHAELLYRQTLEITEKILGKNHPDYAISLNNLAVLYYSIGDYAHAEPLFEQALEITKKILGKNHPNYAHSLNNLAELYRSIGNYTRAEPLYQQEQGITKKVLGKNHPDYATSLNNLAGLYHSIGDYTRAEPLYQQVLQITKKVLSENHPDYAKSLSNLAELYRSMGNYTRAEPLFKQALTIALNNKVPEITQQIYANLGQLYQAAQNYAAAIQNYDQAITITEDLRTKVTTKEHKLSYFKEKIPVYDRLIDLLTQLHHDQPNPTYAHHAFDTFERKQGRIFLEEMGQSIAKRYTGIPKVTTDQEQNLSNQIIATQTQLSEEYSKPVTQHDKTKISNLEKRLAQLQTEEQKLLETIKQNYPTYYNLKHPQPVALDILQNQILQAGELLLVYNVMEKATVLWTISRDHFEMYRLPLTEKQLLQQVKEIRLGIDNQIDTRSAIDSLQTRAIIRKDLNSVPIRYQKLSNLTYQLYNQLIPETVRPLITQAKMLYVVPTGALYAVPFEMLVTQPVHSETDDIHYLIEQLPIAYLSSASLLKTLRDNQHSVTAKQIFLAFADPAYHHPDFSPLPNTAEEAKKIAQVLKDSDALYLQENATMDTLMQLNDNKKLKDYRYLLFATHGIIPGKTSYFDQPALALAHVHPETGQGLLKMADVFALELNAELVSLSACNTGLGQNERGEGMIGLTRAFMFAGTPVIAVTLWSVDTYATEQLNVNFFEQLGKINNPAEALREVKLKMIHGIQEKYRHPYYWAPFVVFGNMN